MGQIRVKFGVRALFLAMASTQVFSLIPPFPLRLRLASALAASVDQLIEKVL
jgi:hypothetical protein